MLPTLSEVKTHLRLDVSGAAEDALLQNLIDTAADYASKYLNRSIPWLDDMGDPVPLPASVKSAMLLIISDLYENREAQFVGVSASDNPVVERLLHFHRVGMGV